MNANSVKYGMTIVVDDERVVVGQPCPDKSSGHWYCVECQSHLYAMQKDVHYDEPAHVETPPLLAWICDEHHVEQP